MRIAVAVAVAFVLALPQGTSAAELGRLFHTPEQRNALDAWRKAKPAQAPAQKRNDPQAAAPAQPARVDGYVLRSDGQSTVWVDGRAAQGPGGRVRVDVRRDLIGEGEIRIKR